ncbi:MAG: formimidoylglutamase [Phycisphaeraceae bacterium]|nr:formimidoylglutamase [Phycisphaeraceae bacterium]
MIPHVAPPFWPETPPGRLAAAIYRNSTDLIDRPEALQEAAAKCRIGLIGLPDDTGIELNHGRPGARTGPHALRAALARYGVATPMPDPARASIDPPSFPRLFDVGDIIPAETLAETHDRVSAAVAAVLDLGLFPIAIGGGHDLTFPFVRAVARRHGPLRGIYFDAHLDVRPTEGSGMPFHRLLSEGHAAALTCIGINPLANSREHFDWYTANGGNFEVFAPDQWPRSGSAGQFVSLDLDVIDSSQAPGVSAMNPCGLSAREIADYVRSAGRCPSVACFDIMELSPPHDENSRTARLAAHLLLQFLLGFAERPATETP